MVDNQLAEKINTGIPEKQPREITVSLQDAAVQLENHQIWDNANINVEQGEFIAVVGPNGSGKSTLFRVLLGMQILSKGQVRVLGELPQRGNQAIGYVPQRRSFDPDVPIRGRDLVMMGLEGLNWGFAVPGPAQHHRQQRVEETLTAVEATAYADRPIGRLSGGEQQRLVLAQALVSKPRLLLLDEPLANLDLRNQIAIPQLVARLARANAATVLLVTHDINPLLPVVDRVIYIAKGKMVIGKPEEVITTKTLSRLYDAPVQVVKDINGRLFVVGLEQETAHPHEHDER
jgi:zinc/manganese transport system ATP-binding protein